MRIVEEDLVDWEPLRMRFIFKEPVVAGRREALVAFIDDWFGAKAQQWLAPREAGEPHTGFVEYCGANLEGDGAVEASVDLIPIEWFQALTEAIERSFPDVDHLRLGFSVAGPTARAEFEWVHVPGGEVMLHGEPVTMGDVDISVYHVSLGQFEEFMRETGYRPVQDRVEGDGSLVESVHGHVGESAKVPALGVTYGDAVAYCEWGGFRLPSEAELYAFFLSRAREGYRFEWGGECWTSDAGPNGTFVVCDGPYAPALQSSSPSLENRHDCYPRDHYDYPWIGFRVAKAD